jgi:Ca-activated chloride channel family protein
MKTFIKTYGLATTALCMIWLMPMIVVSAQAPPSEDGSSALLLILDASGSMNSNDGSGQSKIAAAKQALYQMVDSLPEGSRAGLRVYGHRTSNSERDRAAGCRDTELISPIQELNRQAMKDAIGGFQARGWTPIGSALQAAEKDLPASGQRTIVLVSDGLDTCAPPDPCDVARDMARRGVNLKVHAIGFQVDAQAREQLRCIASATGGSYQDAANAIALTGQLKQLSARATRTLKPEGKLVEGGASYRDAPHLAPGLYNDTILPGEELWYAVDLQSGQSLTAKTAMNRGGSKKYLDMYKVQLVNPLLQEICCGDNFGLHLMGGQPAVVTVAVQTGIVGPQSSNGYTKQPGTYYFRISWKEEIEPVEAPLELSVEVTESSARPIRTEAPAESKDTDGAKSSEHAESGEVPGRSIGSLLVFAAGLGLLAAILGGVLFILLRRRRA